LLQTILARLLALLRALGAGALDFVPALGALRGGQAAKLAILTPALRAFLAALAQPLGAVRAPLLGCQRRAVLRLRRLLRLIALRGAFFGALLAGVADVLAALGALGRRQPAQLAVLAGALRALLPLLDALLGAFLRALLRGLPGRGCERLPPGRRGLPLRPRGRCALNGVGTRCGARCRRPRRRAWRRSRCGSWCGEVRRRSRCRGARRGTWRGGARRESRSRRSPRSRPCRRRGFLLRRHLRADRGCEGKGGQRQTRRDRNDESGNTA
jgi:hypothetical protein